MPAHFEAGIYSFLAGPPKGDALDEEGIPVANRHIAFDIDFDFFDLICGLQGPGEIAFGQIVGFGFLKELGGSEHVFALAILQVERALDLRGTGILNPIDDAEGGRVIDPDRHFEFWIGDAQPIAHEVAAVMEDFVDFVFAFLKRDGGFKIIGNASDDGFFHQVRRSGELRGRAAEGELLRRSFDPKRVESALDGGDRRAGHPSDGQAGERCEN